VRTGTEYACHSFVQLTALARDKTNHSVGQW